MSRISEIDSLYHDSDCCIFGEWKSSIGKLINCNNATYVGSGTGIADGILMDGSLVDFNLRDDVKRSWELFMLDGNSVESHLSSKGMIDQWNLSSQKQVGSLDQLILNNNSHQIFQKAANAFSFLIKDRVKFFSRNGSNVEKIIIGQRLGEFLSYEKNDIKLMFESKTDIPIFYASDRRTACLGAVWKKICS